METNEMNEIVRRALRLYVDHVSQNVEHMRDMATTSREEGDLVRCERALNAFDIYMVQRDEARDLLGMFDMNIVTVYTP